jgi:hypothetical protein
MITSAVQDMPVGRSSGRSPASVVEDIIMDEHAKVEVLAVYATYVAAFRANDVRAIDKLMQYPLAHIGNGQTTFLDAYPIKPAEMKAAKQWHDTRDIAEEVVFASADKAHLVLRRATRVRADGSPIETISVFYALTRTASGWKFFAVSDIIAPA